MMLAGAPLAASAFASQTALSTATTDAWATRPIDIEISGVSWRRFTLPNTLDIDDTLGEKTSCTFTLRNPDEAPVVGQMVRVLYYAEILFAGTMDSIKRMVDTTLSYRTFECTAVDWSQILMRRVLRRSLTYVSVQQLTESLLANELAGETLQFGTADKATSIPLVESKNGRVFDVLRDAASVTGQTMYVDFQKRIQFRATTNEAAPLELDYPHVKMSDLTTDRETYRNAQTVVVTGTPPEGAYADAFVSVVSRENADQIAERASIEGGTGRYEQIEEITHPTSNDGVDCQLMAIGYAQLRLAVSGVPRSTLSCRVRGYGFRAGQFGSVDILVLGVSGTWLIQRASVHDEAGFRLIYEMELVQSSLQQRAYESWLRIVEEGKIVVQMPSAITSNSATFNTPGSTTWTVPSGVTLIQVTCVGGSGGGAGDISYVIYNGAVCIWADPHHTAHGDGGASGRAITIVTVEEGQEVAVIVGTAGTAGLNGETDLSGNCNPYYEGPTTNGANGTASSVRILGTTYCQGDGGGGGKTYANGGSDGTPGSGIGDAISVGGGRKGGLKGLLGDATHAHGPGPTYPIAATAGSDGYVEIQW